MREETDEEFDAFLDGVDRALTREFGPNHQEVLATRGGAFSAFEWGDEPKRIDPG